MSQIDTNKKEPSVSKKIKKTTSDNGDGDGLEEASISISQQSAEMNRDNRSKKSKNSRMNENANQEQLNNEEGVEGEEENNNNNNEGEEGNEEAEGDNNNEENQGGEEEDNKEGEHEEKLSNKGSVKWDEKSLKSKSSSKKTKSQKIKNLSLSKDFNTIKPATNNLIRRDLNEINIHNITPKEFSKYIYSKGVSTAFEVIFSEILSKKIKPEDQFKYAAGRLRDFGRQAGEIISNSHNP